MHYIIKPYSATQKCNVIQSDLMQGDITQYSTLWYNTMWCDAKQCNTIQQCNQCNTKLLERIGVYALRWDAKWYNWIRYDSVKYDKTPYNAMWCIKKGHDKMQCKTIQYDRIGYDAIWLVNSMWLNRYHEMWSNATLQDKVGYNTI